MTASAPKSPATRAPDGPRDIAAWLRRLDEVQARDEGTREAFSPDDLAELEKIIPSLPTASLLRVFHVASHSGSISCLAALIADVAARQVIPLELALTLLREAHNIVDVDMMDAVQTMLETKVGYGRTEAFRQQAFLFRHGPVRALELSLATPQRARTANEAASLAQLLQMAGKTGLALRYLRRCFRKWPSMRLIRNRLLDAYLELGDLAGAEALVTDVAERLRPSDLAEFRLPLIVESGDRARAKAELQALCARRPNVGYDRQLALLHVADGELGAAETVAGSVRDSISMKQQATLHFQVTFLGALVNELRLYQLFRTSGEADGSPQEEEVAAFFTPAVRVIDDWTDRVGGRAGGIADTPIPRRIFQYWNDPTPPPEVSAIMDSWRSVEGWEYTRFDRHGATKWLAETYGADHARAFRLAANVTQESDFLRLCVLCAQGGVYADADDMLIGSAEQMRRLGTGIVLFREPFGGISNNLILSVPGHPILQKAIDMICRSLLARENDNTWCKTGPGLMTRATALHFLDAGETAAQDTTILMRNAWGPFVKAHFKLPYKYTSRYWNLQSGRADTMVREALADLAAVERGPDGRS